MQLHEIVSINPKRMGGTPVFKGTRVPIQSLFDWLSEGIPLPEFLENFPSVSQEQAIAIIELAAQKIIPNENSTGRKSA